jgi:hypothetical protein
VARAAGHGVPHRARSRGARPTRGTFVNGGDRGAAAGTCVADGTDMRRIAWLMVPVAALVGSTARAEDDDPRWGKWIDAQTEPTRPFEIRGGVDVSKVSLSDVGFDSLKGRDYGFVSPTLASFDVQAGTFIRPHWFMGGLITSSWGWTKQDAAPTASDPVVSLGWTRSLTTFGAAWVNEAVFGFDRLSLRAGLVTGVRLLMLTVDQLNKQTPPQTGQFLFIPRATADVYLGAGFAVGAYAQTEAFALQDWGVGGFLELRLGDFRPWSRL